MMNFYLTLSYDLPSFGSEPTQQYPTLINFVDIRLIYVRDFVIMAYGIEDIFWRVVGGKGK